MKTIIQISFVALLSGIAFSATAQTEPRPMSKEVKRVPVNSKASKKKAPIKAKPVSAKPVSVKTEAPAKKM